MRSPSLWIDDQPDSETIADRIQRIQQDVDDIEKFYPMKFYPRRYERLHAYFEQELLSLDTVPFERYSQDERVDYCLIQKYLQGQIQQLQHETRKDNDVAAYLGAYFPLRLGRVLESRQKVEDVDGKDTATGLIDLLNHVTLADEAISAGHEKAHAPTAFRATRWLDSFQTQLREWISFYKDYDPLFTWWVTDPAQKLVRAIEDLNNTIKRIALNSTYTGHDTIIGEPAGRQSLLDALAREMIAYTPEELIDIGRTEYAWCEAEMKKAASAMGFPTWRYALEKVKNDFVPPGEQTRLVSELQREASSFVKEQNLVTVPSICEDTSRTYMMSPERQKVNPFFLGGEELIVSYPTSTMSHEDKMMSMRGNNRHFARATVFHEMIPGHHLQFYYMKRIRPYRQLFFTPFCVEGWAFYWEMLLYENKHWKKSPENKVGMLFWRMHRCARIVFSLKYHLGQMSADECVELLVDWVGHERANAEGEVRRSLMGEEYGPLYQAAYMLGGLQIWKLRQELVNSGRMGEKGFHDAILRANQMPIELMREKLLGRSIKKDFKSQWKFYNM